ncbi:hypothetical protein CVT24_000741 [Panaeolus cyanescens]|uniref:F-box domain-containing protein n=1 Tax=Panaeolus cyanescens TaxID=181874 RepID=A0A409WBK6_9AGAR|nr:hypothetical protein CVT24_000741 [Panaeolus cyanescens]
MDQLPAEIWTQIISHACNDNGFTARSLSQTSHYFHTLSKPFRFRSVVVRGIPQLINFCRILEATADRDRIVKNLFLSTYQHDYEYLNPNPRYKLALLEFYKPGGDPRRFQPTPEEIVDEYEELVIHCLMRILVVVSSTVRNLYIWCTHDRVFLLPPIPLPELVSLTMAGPYTSIQKASSELTPTFPELRRLQLSDLYIGASSMLFTTLKECTPNLTHLRLEPANPYSDGFRTEIKKILNFPHVQNERSDLAPNSTIAFPGSLEKLIIHPGYLEESGGCMTSRLNQFASITALKRLADDPRVIVCMEYPHSRDEDAEEQENVDKWLLSISTANQGIWEEQ